MRKYIIGLIVVLILGLGVTFGYMVSQIKTNDQIIKIGGAGDSATLTYLGNSTDVLVKNTATNLSTNEVNQMQFSLVVESDETRHYTLDTELPAEISITTNREEGVYYYTTGVTYIITIELLDDVEYSDYTFYLIVNFM